MPNEYKTIHIVPSDGDSVVDAEVIDAELAPMSALPANIVSPADTLQPPSPTGLVLTPDQTAEDHKNGVAVRKGGNNDALTNHEKILILCMYEQQHMTQMAIAKALHLNQSTISRTLAKYHDTTILAKRRVKATAEEVLEKFLANAEAKDLLKYLKGVKLPDGTRIVEADREFQSHKSGKSDAPNVFVGVKVDVK